MKREKSINEGGGYLVCFLVYEYLPCLGKGKEKGKGKGKKGRGSISGMHDFFPTNLKQIYNS